MRGDVLTFGGNDQHPWYYHYDMADLLDTGLAEYFWDPKPRSTKYQTELRSAIADLNAIIRDHLPKREPEDTEAMRWLMEQRAKKEQSSQGSIGRESARISAEPPR